MLVDHLKTFFVIQSRGPCEKSSKFWHGFKLNPCLILKKLRIWLSPALKYFWSVVWCSDCHQLIAWDGRTMKHNYNMGWKSIDRNVEVRKVLQWFFQKSFWKTFKICTKYTHFKKSFLKKSLEYFSDFYIAIYGFSAHVIIMFHVSYISSNRLVAIWASHDI